MQNVWVVIVLLVFASTTSGSLIRGPDELAGLLPEDLLDLYGNLTSSQERIMDVAMNGNDGDEEGFFGYIAKRDPELGERAAHVFKGFIDRLSALSSTAQQFYLTLFNGLLRQLTSNATERELKSFANDLVLQWIGLKRSARRNLAVHFPSVAHVLNGRTLRDYAGITF